MNPVHDHRIIVKKRIKETTEEQIGRKTTEEKVDP